MSPPVRLDAVAEQEAEEAYNWYEDQEAGLGERFFSMLAAALTSIEEAREACAPVPGDYPVPVRSTRVRGFPYRVVFVELPEYSRVVAVTHVSRRPRYWRPRLGGPPA